MNWTNAATGAWNLQVKLWYGIRRFTDPVLRPVVFLGAMLAPTIALLVTLASIAILVGTFIFIVLGTFDYWRNL